MTMSVDADNNVEKIDLHWKWYQKNIFVKVSDLYRIIAFIRSFKKYFTFKISIHTDILNVEFIF